jgi:GNAT superfamily N-acetyltransferase
VSTAHTYKLSAYPRTVTLNDKSTVVVKPMTVQDAQALQVFFLHVPERDRYYLKEDVTAPRVIERWARELDYDRALPLLAWKGSQVVANAALIRRRSGARRHNGEIRVVVDPAYRNRGLGSRLIQELLEIAQDSGLERVIFELVADEEDQAIRTAQRLGFVTLATLSNYVRDSQGRLHNLVILEMPLGKWYEWSKQEAAQF